MTLYENDQGQFSPPPPTFRDVPTPLEYSLCAALLQPSHNLNASGDVQSNASGSSCVNNGRHVVRIKSFIYSDINQGAQANTCKTCTVTSRLVHF